MVWPETQTSRRSEAGHMTSGDTNFSTGVEATKSQLK